MSDHRITVTKLIVAVDEVHFVLFITFLDKFGRFEDSELHAIREIVVQMVFDIFGLIIALVFEKISDGGIGFIQWHKAQSFLGFLHGAEQDSVCHPFVAVDGDFVNLDLLGFMDVEKEIDRILDFFVGNLLHIDIAAEETFVYVVLADNVFARDDHIVIHDIALGDVEFFSYFCLLAFRGAFEAESAQAGTVLEANIQKNEISLHAGGRNFHILVQTCVP